MTDDLLKITARVLLFDDVRCHSSKINEMWNNLSVRDKEKYVDKSALWLSELKKVSPKTYEYVINNYDIEAICLSDIAFYIFMKEEYVYKIYSEYGCNIPVDWRQSIMRQWECLDDENRRLYYDRAAKTKLLMEKYDE